MSQDLFKNCAAAVEAAGVYADAARESLKAHLVKDRRLDRALMEEHQYACHGFSWLATYVEALRQTLAWAIALDSESKFGELEELIVRIGFGEYLSQITGGIPMSQSEIIRPADMWVSDEDVHAFHTPAVKSLIEGGNTPQNRWKLARLIEHGVDTGAFGNPGLDDM